MELFTSQISILEMSYILASVLFVLGLKRLSNPDTARSGNLLASGGMLLAIIFTILFHKKEGEHIGNIPWILAALFTGSIVGWLTTKKLKMTATPQMVSLFNGMGGACAALISLMEFSKIPDSLILKHGMLNGEAITIMMGLMIGSISFSGSMIVSGKLGRKIGDITTKGMRYVTLAFLIILLAFLVFILGMQARPSMIWIYLFTALALIYGIMFVMSIDGTNMPVIISLLNSFTGLAVAFGGLLFDNQVMLTGGILVASSGTILTILMCKAKNRSLFTIISGAFVGGAMDSTTDRDKAIKEISHGDAAILLRYSQKILIVPGYGFAVSKAQQLCHELDDLLTSKGVEVKYGIHPVAGRMPGHMNVLLAETDVPYEKLLEMEDANKEIGSTDVVIVAGANDIVNPAAEDDPSSPIYGMPVIKAWNAKNVIVIKRSMTKGYAAIENDLFYHPKTRMLFGDVNASMQQLLAAIKNL
ncbi:MAG: NAD(P)(+) transhydrogenase (Re/Si-specific) subunit beta [Bacteroidota bacterium]